MAALAERDQPVGEVRRGAQLGGQPAPDLLVAGQGLALLRGGARPGDEDVVVLRRPNPRRELADYVRRCLDAAG